MVLMPSFITFFVFPVFGDVPLPDLSSWIIIFCVLSIPFGIILYSQFLLTRRFKTIRRCVKKQEYSYHYLDIVKYENARRHGFDITFCLEGHECKIHTYIDGAKKVHVINCNGMLLCKVDSDITEDAEDELSYLLNFCN